MLKNFSAYTFSVFLSFFLLTSCFDEIEKTIGSIAEGAKVFDKYCADCHDLGEADGKFYLGVTYHLQDLEDYIQSDMPYNAGDECDAQCAADVAAYIQSEMCANETDLTLCEENGKTGSESYKNDDLGIKIARGAVEFKHVCSECHAIPEDTVSKDGADLFTSTAAYFSSVGLQAYITNEMPKSLNAQQTYEPEQCDATCAEEVTLYLQSKFCDTSTTYAFCDGWDPSAL